MDTGHFVLPRDAPSPVSEVSSAGDWALAIEAANLCILEKIRWSIVCIGEYSQV